PYYSSISLSCYTFVLSSVPTRRSSDLLLKGRPMLLAIPNVLTAAQVAEFRSELAKVEWVDGRVTAGHQSAQVKDNLQVPEDHPVARQLGDRVISALGNSPLFLSAALPRKIYPPLFNCYREGGNF